MGSQVRVLVALCVLLAVSQPLFAQNFLKTEPLLLDPHAVVFVNDGSCSAGKILKVTVTRGMHRKKACVATQEVQASLGSSSPERVLESWGKE
jgi:hypothetical protein